MKKSVKRLTPTEKASKLVDSACSGFAKAHAEIVLANEILAEDLVSDEALVDSLKKGIAAKHQQLREQEKLAVKLSEFVLNA